jgi:16S rRNA (guanine966-N2)-methyltransferase
MSRTGLRVIAGTLKGRRLATPDWEGLRPTSDRLRETLFNIVAPRMPDAHVLDAFAGTGAVGIEALSRGARQVTFAERDRRAIDLITANVAHCGVTEGCAIIRVDLGRGPLPFDTVFDLIFLDPPYETNPSGALAIVEPVLARDGLIVIEHARRRSGPEEIAGLTRVREVVSGDSALGFYARAQSASAMSATGHARD